MEEHVCQELVDMEVACQKEMKSAQGVQVDAATLQDPRGQKSYNVYDQQMPGHRRYVIHPRTILLVLFTECIFSLQVLFGYKITKNISFWA